LPDVGPFVDQPVVGKIAPMQPCSGHARKSPWSCLNVDERELGNIRWLSSPSVEGQEQCIRTPGAEEMDGYRVVNVRRSLKLFLGWRDDAPDQQDCELGRGMEKVLVRLPDGQNIGGSSPEC
jgi:hypothetical protein